MEHFPAGKNGKASYTGLIFVVIIILGILVAVGIIK